MFGKSQVWSSSTLSYVTQEPHLNHIEQYLHLSLWYIWPLGPIKLKYFIPEVRRLEDPQLVFENFPCDMRAAILLSLI